MTTAVAEKSAQTSGVPVQRKDMTIRQWLSDDAMKKQFALALPKHLSADRFVRIVLTTMTRTPKLEKCDQASFFQALMTLSQFGLEPDGRRAHLIPFENRSRQCVEVQLIIDYKGLAELAMRSGLVSNIHADVVCENDEFAYDKGIIEKHKIDFRKPRGNPYAAYCIVRFRDGSEKCDVMPKAEIDAIKERSSGWQSFQKGYAKQSPWKSDWNEMAKKTVFRRLSKWLPLSSEFRDAVEHDDDAEDIEKVKQVDAALVGSRSDQLAEMLSQSSDDSTASEGAETQNESREPGDESPEPSRDFEVLATQQFGACETQDACMILKQQYLDAGVTEKQKRFLTSLCNARVEELK